MTYSFPSIYTVALTFVCLFNFTVLSLGAQVHPNAGTLALPQVKDSLSTQAPDPLSGMSDSIGTLASPLEDLTYPFIQYDKNRLNYPGTRTMMNTFYEIMDSVLHGTRAHLNIIEMGGSHVQADRFTHRFREDIVSYRPNLVGSRGLIFPFYVANTNSPANYCTKYTGHWIHNRNSKPSDGQPIGLSGWSVATCDSDATISFRIDPTVHGDTVWLFNKCTLLGASYDHSLMPLIVASGDTIVPYKIKADESYSYAWEKKVDEVKLIFVPYVDYYLYYFIKNVSSKKSQTLVASQLALEDQTDFPRRAEDVFPEHSKEQFYVRGLLCQTDEPGITVHSAGANGASLPSWLRCSELKSDLSEVKPDLVIMAVGINDTYSAYGRFKPEIFKARYRKLISKIRQTNPQCAILFITNSDSFYRVSRHKRIPNRHGIMAQKAFYELAQEYHTAVWDMFEVMGGLGSMAPWEKAKLAKHDKIHFTTPGYTILADLFYQALIMDYTNYIDKTLATSSHTIQTLNIE